MGRAGKVSSLIYQMRCYAQDAYQESEKYVFTGHQEHMAEVEEALARAQEALSQARDEVDKEMPDAEVDEA